jgi:hypothetical protein
LNEKRSAGLNKNGVIKKEVEQEDTHVFLSKEGCCSNNRLGSQGVMFTRFVRSSVCHRGACLMKSVTQSHHANWYLHTMKLAPLNYLISPSFPSLSLCIWGERRALDAAPFCAHGETSLGLEQKHPTLSMSYVTLIRNDRNPQQDPWLNFTENCHLVVFVFYANIK